MGTVNADLKGKSILFIAYFYSPVSSTSVPGAMRTIKFIRNLSGGQFHVLTHVKKINEYESALSHLSLPISDERIYYASSWDIFKGLLKLKSIFNRITNNNKTDDTNSPTVKVKSDFKALVDEKASNKNIVQKIKDLVYNTCYFPDQAGPWIMPAFLKGRNIVNKENIDVIFATGSPWSALLTGYLIAKLSKKPLIADFRDPWVNNPFHLSKGKFLDRLSKYLESKIVNGATLVSLNTQPLKEDFMSRYPNILDGKFIVLPNGFDPIDYSDVSEGLEGDDSKIIFSHAGFLYGVRDPATLLNAIQKANSSLSEETPKICFKQIGKININYDIRVRYKDMLDNGTLILYPPKKYKECLSELESSDWVVNIQPGTKTQVPSKLYDYLAINRPILNITEKEGALGKLVKEYELGELFDFNEESLLAARLIEIANTFTTKKSVTSYTNAHLFNCKNISKSLADEINRLTDNSQN